VEQAIRSRHGHQRCNLRAAARLAEHHHSGRVAAKFCDVLADPFERADQVELAEIAAVTKPIIEGLQPAITEHVDPMIDRHHHHITARCEVRALRQRIGHRTVVVRATVEIDHDRTPGPAVRFGGPDVEEQAVLACL
jgi:hypothetical protein